MTAKSTSTTLALLLSISIAQAALAGIEDLTDTTPAIRSYYRHSEDSLDKGRLEDAKRYAIVGIREAMKERGVEGVQLMLIPLNHVMVRTDDPKQREYMYRWELAAKEQIYGSNSPKIKLTLSLLASDLERLGKTREAALMRSRAKALK